MQTSCCLHTARPCELSLVLYDALFIRPPSEGASEMEPSLAFFLPIEVFSLALIFKLVSAVLRESQRHMIEQSPTQLTDHLNHRQTRGLLLLLAPVVVV